MPTPAPERPLARIKSLASSARSAARDAWGGFSRWLSGLLWRAQATLDEGMKKPRGRSLRPLSVALACALAATILLFLLLGSPGERGAREAPAGAAAWNPSPQSGLIPSEELFLPREPDFLPGTILGREPSPRWTETEARAWWRDPLLEEGEEPWRAAIESAAAEIMENVP